MGRLSIVWVSKEVGVAQLSQSARAARWVILAKSRRRHYASIVGLSPITVT